MSLMSMLQEPSAPAEVPPPDPPEAAEAVALIARKLERWLEGAIELLPNFAVAVLTLLAFWLLAKIAKRILRAAMRRTPLTGPLTNLFVTTTGVVIVATGLFVALGVLGLDRTVMSLLAGVGIIGLALGFAFQDIAANFIAGILLSVRRPIHVGDIVETNDFFGTVDEINLRSTILRTPTGQTVFVPNKEVFEKPIVNYSKAGRRRVDLEVGVSYGDDLQRVRELAMGAVASVEQRDQSRDIEFFYTRFGDSSIDLVVRFWIDFTSQADYLAACSEAIVAVKSAFDRGGVTIPFPIRTLDFGIVGGERLADHLAGRQREAPRDRP